MPVHLLNGLTRERDRRQDTSVYKPVTETIHPRPDPETEELKPKMFSEDEDPCN